MSQNVRQVVLIFSLDPESFPEACAVSLEALADDIQDAIDVQFEILGEDEYFSEKQLTHIIVRDMEGNDEKDITARKVIHNESENSTLTQETKPL